MKNIAEVYNIEKNVLGTISISFKIKGMRKPQEFCTYPIKKDDRKITIQSNKRIATLNLDGQGLISQNHQNGAYFHHLNFDKLTDFEFSKKDWQQVVEYIGLTESNETGKKENGVILSDNSGAKSIFNL